MSHFPTEGNCLIRSEVIPCQYQDYVVPFIIPNQLFSR